MTAGILNKKLAPGFAKVQVFPPAANNLIRVRLFSRSRFPRISFCLELLPMGRDLFLDSLFMLLLVMLKLLHRTAKCQC